MKSLIFVALVVFGLALAFGGTGNSDAQDNSRIQQGVQQIDSYLQKGLTPEAHDALSRKARASADFLTGIEQRAMDATK
jgi:hypothetical protein